MMTDALRTELARSFTVVTAPRADTLRLKVTILGAENTRGGSSRPVFDSPGSGR